MDAKQLLRQYLEQRRELGESEFVLDGLSVADALRALGAGPPIRTSPPGAAPSPPVQAEPTRTRAVREATPSDGDWRAVLRAAGAAPESESKSTAPPSPPPQPDPATPVVPPASAATPTPPGIIVGSESTELFAGPLSRAASIDDIAALVRACTACALHAQARNPVPGEGNPHAQFVCVGEAPGANEDETGRPFVGQAGQLLTKILAAIDLKREDVFICNVLKHRPPGNRNPAPDEIVACKPFLLRQLEVLRPKVILALGTFAAQTLLETKLAIGKLRGSVHRFYGIPLVVTYHPAALLRNPNWKRPTWEDVQLARRLLDRSPDGG